MESEDRKLTQRLINQRALALANRVGPCVRPLIVEEEAAGPSVVGSGLFLRIHTSLFLLTAAHVLDRWPKDLLTTGPGGLVALNGQGYSSLLPEGGRKHDRLDAAVIRLDTETAQSLEGSPVAALSDVDLDDRAVGGPNHYVLIGFPSTRARLRRWERRFICEASVLTLNPASLQSYALAGVPDYSNIVLEFDPNSAVNESGKVTPPKLNGVSGGAVWSLGPTYDAEGTGAKLVAVVTERHGGEVRAIVGTRLAVFLAIIWDNYSDLVAFLPHPTSADTRI